MIKTSRHYFDYNATTPLSPLVKTKIIEALDLFGNPSSTHYEGRLAKSALHEARSHVAKLIGFNVQNCYFTSGASEAAATLLTPYYALGRNNVFMSCLYLAKSEHPAILNGGQFNPQQICFLSLDEKGLIDQNDLKQKLEHHDLSKGLPLVAIQAANNETGILQPLEDLAKIIRNYSGVLVVDGVQIFGKKAICQQTELGDFVIGSGHKFGGLKGCGFWAARENLLAPKALIRAGGQEKGLRGGTESLLSILSCGYAAEAIASTLNSEEKRLKQLRMEMEHSLKTHIKGLFIYGENVPRLANTSLFSIQDVNAQTIQIAADLAGFSISAGAACSSGKIGPNQVLEALGEKSENGAIRVSLGATSSEENVKAFCLFLIDWVKRTL